MLSKRRRRNRFSNLFGGGLLLASSISLVSIGFSTWSIGSGNGPASADLNIDASDVFSLLTLKSKQSGYNFSKYGFTDSSSQIFDSTTYSFLFSLDQEAIKSSGYIKNDAFSFNLTIQNVNSSSKFLDLFSQEFYSASIKTTYNSIASEQYNLTIGSNLSSSFSLPNITSNASEDMKLDLIFSFNSSKQADLATYFDELAASSNLSFSLKLEVIS